MTPKIEKINELGYKLTLSIPSNQIEESVEAKATELSRDAVLKGFRKGKAPMRVVMQRFGAQIRGDEINRLVQERFKSSLEEESLNPVWFSAAKLKNGADQTATSDLEAEVLLEVGPEVTLDFLENVSIKRPNVSVTDEDIETQLQQYLNRFKEWSQVDRPAQEGDRISFVFLPPSGDASAEADTPEEEVAAVPEKPIDDDETQSSLDKVEDDHDHDVHHHEGHDHAGHDHQHAHQDAPSSAIELVIGDTTLSQHNQKICEVALGASAGDEVVVEFGSNADSDSDPNRDANVTNRTIKLESVASSPDIDLSDEVCEKLGLPYKSAAEMREAFTKEIDKHVSSQQTNLIHRQLYDMASKKCSMILPHCQFREAFLQKINDFHKNTDINLADQAFKVLKLTKEEVGGSKEESITPEDPLMGNLVQSTWARTMQENAWVFVLKAMIEKHNIEPNSETVNMRINEALSDLAKNPNPELEDHLFSEQNYREMMNQTVVEQVFDEMVKVVSVEDMDCPLSDLLSGKFEEQLVVDGSDVKLDERTDIDWFNADSGESASTGTQEMPVSIESSDDSAPENFQPVDSKAKRWRLPWLKNKDSQ